MAMEKASSTRNTEGNYSEMVPQERPIMAADLFQAAFKGNSDVLDRYLGLPAQEQHHIKVTVETSKSETQVTQEDKEVVEYKLRSATAFGDTVLHILIANGHNDLALKVFQKDASLMKVRNKNFETPLHQAAKFGNADIIQSLIQFAPTLMKDALEETNNDGDTTLHLAAKHSHPNVGEKLLKFNQELVYKVNKEGFSPLHIAIVENQHAMIELILSFEDSLGSVQFSNGQFPIHVAARMSNINLILFLLKNFPDYANLHNQNGQNFFHIAAEENIKEVYAAEVIKEGAKMLQKKDCDGNTPLHIAAKKGNIAIMTAIWKSLSSYVPEENNKGETPFDFLDIAIKNSGLPELIELRSVKHVKYSGRNLESLFMEPFMVLRPAKNGWERSQLLGLGSVLITTVAFAAAFTFAGGYSEDTGVPVLGRRFMFRAFILANALAFMQSFLCVCVLVVDSEKPGEWEVKMGSFMFLSAASCMMLAFGTGSYVMLAPVNMPIAIIILVLAVLLGSPAVFILYSLQFTVFYQLIYRGNVGFIYILTGVYAMTFLFAFCLAFLK